MEFKEHIAAHSPYIGGTTRPDDKLSQSFYKLSSNENLLGPSPLAVEAISKQLLNLHEYQHQDDGMLRAALSQSFEGTLNSQQFLCANSGMELLDMICRGFLDPGDEAIISTPTFLAYKSFIEINGARTVDVPLIQPGYSIDVNLILSMVNNKTKLLFISSPNNPVGTIVTKTEMDRLLQQLPPHVVVVYDEVYHHFVEDTDYAMAIEYIKMDYPVIGIHSFSKSYGLAGIRLGYAFSTDAIAGYLNRLRRPFMINSLSMAAGMAALLDIDHLARTIQMVKDGKRFLYHQFMKLDFPFIKSQGNFVFFIPDILPRIFAAGMLKEGVMVRTAEVFGAPEGVRVTIGTQLANEAFIAAAGQLL